MISIIIFSLLGTLCGIFTGLVPGLHINLVASILVFLSLKFQLGIEFAFFIVAMSISHTFSDFIPSIFLGASDTDTEMSILPGHEMLLEGKGYEAVLLTLRGGIIGLIIIVLISPVFLLVLSKLYLYLEYSMFFVLLAIILFLCYKNESKVLSLFIFILAGFFGLAVFNLNLKESLLPLLSGMFAASALILGIKNKIKIDKQFISDDFCLKDYIRPFFASFVSSICSIFPGLGSNQAALIANSVIQLEKRQFLILSGAVNTIIMGLSFIVLYIIGKSRSGSAAAVNNMIELNFILLFELIIVMIVSGVISFYVSKKVSSIAAVNITKINYSFVSAVVLFIITLLIFIFSGFLGILVFIIGISIGITCILLGVKRKNLMGCLLIPTIIYYF